ncbi:DNA-directed RNA polymerase, mitochondrial-like isoform X4 [Ostrea edulis]|uniref:DNA-directed RNA polymerase, mitochondrial-like isoform X4 n=1 Tax=Ostrea edulis TaxID=37623 RepID=UPI0024AEA00D|nr:DNA-directed RNA polymerase, mitochondrial-like isoform X4 [Ostrea edulis]
MTQLLRVWATHGYHQNFRKLLNQGIYNCKSCSILRYSSESDKLEKVTDDIPVKEMKESPVIFSKGKRKPVSKEMSPVSTQLQILSAGLEKRKLQLYVEKWFKDHWFTSSKVEFKTVDHSESSKVKRSVKTAVEGGKKRKKKKTTKTQPGEFNVAEASQRSTPQVDKEQIKDISIEKIDLNETYRKYNEKVKEERKAKESDRKREGASSVEDDRGSPIQKSAFGHGAQKLGKTLSQLRKAEFAKDATAVKKKHYNEDLLSYIWGYVMGGKIHHAHSVLMQHTVKPEYEITEPQIFNCVLLGWARKGNEVMLTEALTQMKKFQICEHYDTFAAKLLCIGSRRTYNKETIRDILQQMEEMNLDIRCLIQNCEILTPRDASTVLKVIQSVDPDYSHLKSENLTTQHYSVPLLRDFNASPPEDAPNPLFQVISSSKFEENLQKQLKFEETGTVSMDSTYFANFSKKQEKTKELLVEQFRGTLTAAFKFSLQKYSKDLEQIWPFLNALKTNKYIDLMIKEIEVVAEKEYSAGYRKYQLGQSVINSIKMKYFKESGYLEQQKMIYKEYIGIILSKRNPNRCHREIWQSLCLEHTGKSTILPDYSFPDHISFKIGKFLYSLMNRHLKILSKRPDGTSHNIPVFCYASRDQGKDGRVLAFIQTHPRIKKMFMENSVMKCEQVFYPMIVPPVPWHGKQLGGFITFNSDLIRCLDDIRMELKYLQKYPEDSLHPVMDSLNTLGTCGWKINTKMLDVIMELFKKDAGSSLDLPPAKHTLPKPVFPLLEVKEMIESKTENEDEKKKKMAELWRKYFKMKKDRAETHSLWCHMHKTLSLAESIRDEVIWFPHNLDFRGRSYPFMPHLNYHGDDVRRSLFQFANGKPLGEKGLDWLKIHLINLTGFAKRSSNTERLHLANKLLPDIMDSADNPLEGRKWWQTSDEPFQTLAVCMEVTTALRSEDPTQFVSYFPTHQDGSCNGLQHYAALGRDQAGAESVNLSPFTHPQDVYSDVVELVEKIRQKDAEEGLEIAQKLEGLIKRKTIKQTIMTSVYGVTMYGAKLQIYKQINPLSDEALPSEFHMPASVYLARCAFKALEEMFSSARSIQDWFTQIARGMAKSCKLPTQWIMPMGMPVIQPYIKLDDDMKFKRDYNIEELLKFKIESRKQRNGFPPNYIHSIDASHMMLTSLEMYRAGLTFASVHDCYWTHANDVDLMNKLCRKQFVALHSQPLLETLSADFMRHIEKYQKEHPKLDKSHKQSVTDLRELVCSVPQKGTFDLDKVLESEYFFS